MSKDPILELLALGDKLEAKATPGPWVTQSNCDYRIVSDTHVICESDPKADFSHGMTRCLRNTSLILHSCNTRRAHAEIIRTLADALEKLRVPVGVTCSQVEFLYDKMAEDTLAKARAIAEGALK